MINNNYRRVNAKYVKILSICKRITASFVNNGKKKKKVCVHNMLIVCFYIYNPILFTLKGGPLRLAWPPYFFPCLDIRP